MERCLTYDIKLNQPNKTNSVNQLNQKKKKKTCWLTSFQAPALWLCWFTNFTKPACDHMIYIDNSDNRSHICDFIFQKHVFVSHKMILNQTVCPCGSVTLFWTFHVNLCWDTKAIWCKNNFEKNKKTKLLVHFTNNYKETTSNTLNQTGNLQLFEVFV